MLKFLVKKIDPMNDKPEAYLFKSSSQNMGNELYIFHKDNV